MGKNWFITGTSRGFGREWTIAALERGDKVAATARKTASLADLVTKYGDRILPISLDVTNREDCFEAVEQAKAQFGRLDVVVNNAGYGHFGFVEEISEKEARAQFDTNVFGALWITQAALPHLREQRSGHFLQVSSIGGITAFAGLGMYHASKWALEALSDSLSKEVASFGIHVTLIEPGGFDTDWSGSSAARSIPIEAYAAVKEQMVIDRKTRMKRGDHRATAKAIMDIVDAETPPLRVFLGSFPLGIAKDEYAKRIATWEAWQDVSVAAQGD